MDGKRTYALEGSIFIAGASCNGCATACRSSRGGIDRRAGRRRRTRRRTLFSFRPSWASARPLAPDARGALFGLTRATGAAELARATLQSVTYQIATCWRPAADWPDAKPTVLRVAGGMVASNWMLQDLADMLDMAVDRPTILEITALGAAWLAGHYAGILPDQSGFADLWRLDRRFKPHLSALERQRRFATWKKAVRATISMTGPN